MAKHWFVTTLMVVTVVLFLFLKITGQLRMSDINPISAAGLRLVLFIVSAGFFGVTFIRLLYSLIGYHSTPLDILLYVTAALVAGVVSFMTTAWLTRE